MGTSGQIVIHTTIALGLEGDVNKQNGRRKGIQEITALTKPLARYDPASDMV